VAEHVAEDVQLAVDDLELGRVRAELDAIGDAVRAEAAELRLVFRRRGDELVAVRGARESSRSCRRASR
jgi:hypothetical protein